MNKKIHEQITRLGGIRPIRNQFILPSEDEIVSIEQELGVSLPKDYREYLKMYGSSSPPTMVEFHLLNSSPLYASAGGMAPKQEAGPFSHFYGFSGGTHNIRGKIVVFKNRMPNTIIPIGDDGMGNQICIGITGEERDKIFYWDHEYEWDEEDYFEEHGTSMPPKAKFQNVYLIANSFEEFLSKLEVVEN